MVKIVSLFLLIAIFSSCKKDPAGIILTKNLRYLQWEADTLDFNNEFQFIMRSISGVSSQDVYIAGYSSGGPEMAHYNGVNWEIVNYYNNVDISVESFGTIYALSENQIWAAGGDFSFNSVIISFHGDQWVREKLNKTIGYIKTIWGSSTEDLWAGGIGGLLKYDDGEWIYNSFFLPNLGTIKDERDLEVLKIHGNKDNRFMLVRLVNSENYEYFLIYKYVNPSWKLFTVSQSFTADIWVSPSGRLYLAGKEGVSYYQDTVKVPILDRKMGRIYGWDDRNVFASFAGNYGSYLMHFNGADWEEIFTTPPSEYIFGLWTDGNEAFVVSEIWGRFGTKTIVYHGY